MKKLIRMIHIQRALLVLFLSVSTFAFAQPGSEIFVFDLSSDRSLTNPRNVTNHPGYDNQPSFDHKGKLYYSSFNAEGRSDLKVYDFKKKNSTSLTTTSEREYSPTLTPDKKFISCIIQRDNNAQDLGKYPLKGGSPTILIADLIVGYHAWIDPQRVMIFVLGDPNTLQVYNVQTKERKIIAERVGRSLHKIPGQQAMSFVSKANDQWEIMRWDILTGTVTSLGKTLPAREDMAWTPDGHMIMSDGSSIYSRKPEQADWLPLSITGKEVLKGVTRLAVNAKGNQLAVVVAE